MSREQKLTGFILKKQAFGEADEIITFFTKEEGKIRALAKSIKSAKSKLQGKLQALFLVNIILAGKSLPKIISAETVEVYENLRQDLECAKTAFYASELVLRVTADEQKNEQLFKILEDYFKQVSLVKNSGNLDSFLVKFKIEVMEAAGLSIIAPALKEDTTQVFFSPSSGGFNLSEPPSSQRVGLLDYKNFLSIKQSPWENMPENLDVEFINQILSHFIEYQLERKIKSEQFLNIY